MSTLKIIVTSTRPNRVGHRIGDWFAGLASTHNGFDVELVDLAEVGLPMLDEPGVPGDDNDYVNAHTKSWSATIDAADAIVFVLPEYNRGFPASVKNAIDYLYREWQGKPVGIVNYGMSSGGLRAAQMLGPVLTAVGMVPVSTGVSVFLRRSLTEDGELIVTDSLVAAGTELLDELARFTAALRPVPIAG